MNNTGDLLLYATIMLLNFTVFVELASYLLEHNKTIQNVFVRVYNAMAMSDDYEKITTYKEFKEQMKREEATYYDDDKE